VDVELLRINKLLIIFIVGLLLVGSVSAIPGDNNNDGCITLGEVSSFVAQWLGGSVSLFDVNSAVNVWLGGCVSVGRTFYVSVSGNDINSGTSESASWQSLSKVNSMMSTFKPGDRILFKRGDSWYGSLIVGVSGNTTAPITFSAYGAGAKPVISGFTTLSSWSSVGGGVYQSYCPLCNSSLNMVTVNGLQQRIGRYPNTGYLTFESHYAKSSITDNELPSNPVWTGAEVVIRTSHWTMDRDIVTSHVGNTITYAPFASYAYEPTNGFGYFIQNDPKTLDQFGEWYFNPSTKYLQMYFGSNTPSSYVVKASTLDTLASIVSRNYITFDNLEFQGSNVATINIKNSNYVTIQNCEIDFSGTNAIYGDIGLPGYVRIENTLINNSNNDGISFLWYFPNAVLRNNTIENTGMIAGMGKSGAGSYTAIRGGSNNTIEYNKIENTGYIPITFIGDYTIVKNNYINRFCLVLDDCGGIYTSRGSPTSPVEVGRKVVNNIILNCIGAPEGTTSKIGEASGIYLDEYTTGVEVNGNTVANCNYAGIFVNSDPNGKILNNILYNNWYQIYLRVTPPNVRNRENLIMQNNTLFSKLPSQISLRYGNNIGDLDSTFSSDRNYFVRPFDDRYVIQTSPINGAEFWMGNHYTLEDWQLAYNRDLNSKTSPRKIPKYTINSLIGSNKFSNGNFDSTISGVSCWNDANSCVLSWDNTGKLDGGSLKISYSSSISTKMTLVSIPIGAISSNKNYILKYSFLGSKKNDHFDVYLRNNVFNILTPRIFSSIDTSRIENEFLFSNPVSENAASIILEINQSDGIMWVDNIQLYEADVTLNDPDYYMRLEYNPNIIDKIVPLSGSYIGVDGRTYSGSITLKPFTSIILIKN